MHEHDRVLAASGVRFADRSERAMEELVGMVLDISRREAESNGHPGDPVLSVLR
jgi:hypothetical protein